MRPISGRRHCAESDGRVATKRVICACAPPFAAVMLSGVSVQADLLNLVLIDSPDVVCGSIDVTYNAVL